MSSTVPDGAVYSAIRSGPPTLMFWTSAWYTAQLSAVLSSKPPARRRENTGAPSHTSGPTMSAYTSTIAVRKRYVKRPSAANTYWALAAKRNFVKPASPHVRITLATVA